LNRPGRSSDQRKIIIGAPRRHPAEILMCWRKLLWGTFWVLCTAILLCKAFVLPAKGLLLLWHVADAPPWMLAIALIILIAGGLSVLLCSRSQRGPVSG
jgi:hypothetical protein